MRNINGNYTEKKWNYQTFSRAPINSERGTRLRGRTQAKENPGRLKPSVIVVFSRIQNDSWCSQQLTLE